MSEREKTRRELELELERARERIAELEAACGQGGFGECGELESLRRSEERFRSLFDNVDMIAVQGYDEQRRVVYWNPASEHLYGYSRDEALGRQLEDLIIPEPLRQAVISMVTDWVERDIPIPPGEYDLLHKDGSVVPVYSSHVMQSGRDGSKVMYCIDVNLADVRMAHDELMAAKNLAEEASRAKSEFLANMSHEIRTPLNGLMGMLQVMRTTDLDSEQLEYVDLSLQSSKRLTRLLSDILDLSRVEAGKLRMRFEPFDLPQLVAEVGDLFKPMARQENTRLELAIRPGVPRYVRGDAARLQQVLTNLIGNACKFASGGEVAVEVESLSMVDADKVRLLFSVSDTGMGIAADKLDKLFTPFTQVNEGYRRNHQGAGLGLSICKQLVGLMGGSIAVESEEGKGTRLFFTVTLGEADADAAAEH